MGEREKKKTKERKREREREKEEKEKKMKAEGGVARQSRDYGLDRIGKCVIYTP